MLLGNNDSEIKRNNHMKIKIRQMEGIALASFTESKATITMDAPADLGGITGGPRPMELMLTAIAGCAVMDVLSILKKKRVKIYKFEMQAEAEQAEEHPKVFTKVNLKYIIYGREIKNSDVERAIELTAEKYCAATAMIKESTKINHYYEIKDYCN
jgi:putative redox protein